MMGYSLLSQFQGSLLGVSLGLWVNALTDIGAIPGKRPNLGPAESLSKETLGLILNLAASLIQHRDVVWDDWREIWQTHPQALLSRETGWTAPIAALPMILLFHENPAILKQKLHHLAQLWYPDPSNTASNDRITVRLLGFAAAITHLLSQPQNLNKLIPSLLAQVPQENEWAQQLIQVNALLEQGASLDQTVYCLSTRSTQPLKSDHYSLAIALYCFLSTPEAFSISVQRAMNTPNHSGLICALTAALSGAYNGLIGIPIGWKLRFKTWAQTPIDSFLPPINPQILPSDQQILIHGAQLFYTWAGTYLPTDPEGNPLSSLMVTAPSFLPN